MNGSEVKGREVKESSQAKAYMLLGVRSSFVDSQTNLDFYILNTNTGDSVRRVPTINKPTLSNRQTSNRPTDQPTNRSTNQPTSQPTSQLTNRSTSKPTPTIQPTNKPQLTQPSALFGESTTGTGPALTFTSGPTNSLPALSKTFGPS